MNKIVTLLFLRREDEILLAMKKRGFGKGNWNGVGGKVDRGETVEEAAIRECQEEIGVLPDNLELMGRLHFYMKEDEYFYHDARIFQSSGWTGEPIETEEMKPQWFKETNIPYDKMWPADHLWLPTLLKDKKFTGAIILGKELTEGVNLKEVSSIKELE